jgi:trigger factor
VFDEINSKVEEKISQAAKTFKIPGFREGKVPMSIIRQKMSKEETEKEIQEKISFVVKELINSTKISIYSKTKVEILSFNQNDGLSIRVEFDIMPLIPKIEWNTIKVEKINLETSEQDVLDTKNNLLKEFRKFKKAPNSYKAKLGDRVTINFHATINGEEFDGNTGENTVFIIGDNKFFVDLENQLVNMSVNQEKDFTVTFPSNYPKKELVNQQSDFKIKVVDLEELETITDVSSEILQKIGIKSEEQLNEMIQQKIKMDFMGSVRLKMKKEEN